MRLPVYPAPGLGESLSSYTIRLATSNGLRPTQLTHRLGLPDFWQRDVDVTATGEMLERLAEATGQSVANLEQCTVTPLLTALHGPFRPDSSPRYLVASGRHRGAGQARGLPACPACLAQGQVLRHWRLTTTVVCETHGLPLVDRCGGCGAPVDHVRLYRDFSQRLRLVDRPFHRCARCGEVLTSPATGDLGAALYVQGLMTQAVTTGEVRWDGLFLPAETFQAILNSVMRLYFPARAQTGKARWRPETSVVEARLPVVLAAGEDLREGLIGMLRRWRARGVRLHLVLREDLPEWYRQVLRLGLSVDTQGLVPTWQTRGTYVFTDRQWRVVSTVLPPVPRTSRHGHPARAVLRAWLTRNLKHLSAAEWSGAWVGQVSAVAMSRRIREMAASGVLDRVIAQMLTLPECLPVLTAPGTVYALERLGSVHTEHLWTLMLEQAVRTLPSTCRAADGGAAVGAPAG